MSQSQQNARVMINGQTTDYETADTPDEVWPRVQRVTPSDDNGNVYDYGLGEGLNAVAAYIGPYASGGSIDFSVADFTPLRHWIGPMSGSGTAGTPYKLTEATGIGYSSSFLQPFTMDVANITEATDSVDRYVGCLGLSFSLSAQVGGKLECSAPFVARHSALLTTAQSYTPNTENAYVMINGTWKWGSTPTALSGVKGFKVNYNNNLDVGNARVLESRFIEAPVMGIREYKLSVDINMSSTLGSTIYNDFYGQSPASGPHDGSTSINPISNLEFSAEFINGSRYATIQLDQCNIDKISKPQSVGGGIVVLSFEVTALYAKDNEFVKWWSV